MAEKRSIPTALGLLIGPAAAYLSYLVFKSSINELWQIVVFLCLFFAGHNLAKGGLSLSGSLFVLFMPALPFALYLNALATPQGHQLSAIWVISLWLFSAVSGALLAGLRQNRAAQSAHVTNLIMMAISLAVLIILAQFLR